MEIWPIGKIGLIIIMLGDHNKIIMYSESIKSALTFLSASQGDQIAYLAKIPAFSGYYDSDGNIEEYHASEVCLYACSSILSRMDHHEFKKNNEVINEILCVIEMALLLADNVIDYHMDINKTGVSATGPLDEVWNVLRRLASIAWTPTKCSTEFSCINLLHQAEYKEAKR